MWHSIKKRPNVKNYKDIVTIIKKYVAMSLNLPSTNHRLFFFSFYCTSEISRKNSGNNNDKVHPVFCASSDVIVATICMMYFYDVFFLFLAFLLRVLFFVNSVITIVISSAYTVNCGPAFRANKKIPQKKNKAFGLCEKKLIFCSPS